MSCMFWMLTAVVGFNDVPLALPGALAEVQRRRIETVGKVTPTVVAVFGRKGDGGGSGVLVSADGYALSNYHVTSGAGDWMKCGLADGRLYDAVVVGIDPVGDVALIKLLGRPDFPHATLGDSDAVRVGDEVIAAGNPFLLATDYTPTVTLGIVSGTHRYQYPSGTLLEYTDCLQTDASINPGNSGGPLFDLQGRLIGINGRISLEKRGRVNVGVGYAISINQIKHFMKHLKGGHVVDHATLGATVFTADDGRVLVDQVSDASPAYLLGLRSGDEVVSFGGRPIGSANQFKNVLGIYPTGWTVPLVYRRDQTKHAIKPHLLGVHQPDALAKNVNPDGPAQLLQRVTLPKRISRVYQRRDGYANFHFQSLNRQRLLDAVAALGDYPAGTWRLTFRDAEDKRVTVSLGEESLELALPDAPPLVVRAANVSSAEPAGSGGLLVALDQYRRLLIDGAKWFSDVTCVGGAPLPDGRIADVLATTRNGVRTRWLFAADDTGELRLVRFETTVSGAVLPCVVDLADERSVGGATLPHRMVVRHAGGEFAEWILDVIDLNR